jgi:hypothetical protein
MGYGVWWVQWESGLICCVVVVDPEITLVDLERERHSAVLGKGVVHLCVCVRVCMHEVMF